MAKPQGEKTVPQRRLVFRSTYREFEAYRAKFLDHLRGIDEIDLVAMEDFGARGGWPKAHCLQAVRNCEIFVGVIGHLCSFVPSCDASSMTRQEYEAAVNAALTCLIFTAPDELSPLLRLCRAGQNLDRREAFRAGLS